MPVHLGIEHKNEVILLKDKLDLLKQLLPHANKEKQNEIRVEIMQSKKILNWYETGIIHL